MGAAAPWGLSLRALLGLAAFAALTPVTGSIESAGASPAGEVSERSSGPPRQIGPLPSNLGPRTDDLIVEVHAGAFARRTMLARTDGEQVLLPVEETLALLELDFESALDGSVLSALEPQRTELWIDPAHGIARRGDEELRGWGLVHDWVPYAEAGWLARWLGIRAHVDLLELVVRLDPVTSLPIGRRVLRERSRTMALDGGELDGAATFVQTESGWVQGLVLDWGIRNPGLVRPDDGSLDLGLGSAVGGGALDLHWRRNLAQGEGSVDGSWHGVWPERQWVRQLELGRTQTTSPRGGTLRGAALSNSPYRRDARFGAETVRGQLPPDWEVEVYQYGRLIAFDTVDATGWYEFELPVDYGQNPVEIRAYGPHGEERVVERATRVDFDRLPAGAFEYGLSGGDCLEPGCASAWNLDLRQGLHERWTVRGGVEHFERDLLTDRTHPYAAVIGALGRGWRLRASSALRAQHEVRLGFEPSLRWRSELALLRFDDRDDDPVWQPHAQRSRLELSLLSRPVRSLRTFFLSADLQRRKGLLGEQWRSELGLRHGFAGLRGFVRWRESWEADVPFGSRASELRVGASAFLRSSMLGPLANTFLRAETRLDLGRGDNDEISLGLARRLAPGTRLELGARWDRSRDELGWSVALSATGAVSHLSTGATGRRADTVLQSSAEGSLVYNHGTNRFETDALRGRGSGGLQGVVFEDLNGNGIRDPDELGVGGVELVVGHRSTTTDPYGRYGVWQLLAFEETVLAIDPASIPDPLLVPNHERMATHVVPNGFSTLDIPLLRGAELTAHLWVEEGQRRVPAGNIRVWLEGEERGLRYDGRSFGDGELYLLGVAPDRYRVNLDPAVLARAGLEMVDPDLQVEVPIRRRDRTVIVLDIVLRRISGHPD